MGQLLGPSLRVEDDLWYLSILHARPVVVPGRVAELEGHLPPVVAVHRHLHTGNIGMVQSIPWKTDMMVKGTVAPDFLVSFWHV